MKRIGILLTLLFITTAIFAQKGKVTSALSYKDAGELEKAWETIEQTIDPENSRSKRSIDWSRTWEARGEILREIHRQGKKEIVDEPLFKALKSFNKGIELDEKDRYTKSIVVDLKLLQIDFSNYAIKSFQSEDFDASLKSFEKFLEISSIPAVKESIEKEILDTAIIYNTGLAALKAENWEKAVEYFQKSANVDYNGPESYQFTYNSYQSMGDSAKAVETLKEGFEKYPDNETLIVSLINYYIETGNANDAVTYLDKAIKQNPKNVSYYTAKGSTLEKLEEEDKAIEVYKQAIERDSTLFTPYYNLGVIHYNNGVAVMNEASQLPPNATKEYDAKIEEGRQNLKKALPYMERAYEIDSTEMAIMESLRQIYYRLKLNDKYDKINEQIKNISK
jgi:tetratricopeptide (TPR) repeat protein